MYILHIKKEAYKQQTDNKTVKQALGFFLLSISGQVRLCRATYACYWLFSNIVTANHIQGMQPKIFKANSPLKCNHTIKNYQKPLAVYPAFNQDRMQQRENLLPFWFSV